MNPSTWKILSGCVCVQCNIYTWLFFEEKQRPVPNLPWIYCFDVIAFAFLNGGTVLIKPSCTIKIKGKKEKMQPAGIPKWFLCSLSYTANCTFSSMCISSQIHLSFLEQITFIFIKIIILIRCLRLNGWERDLTFLILNLTGKDRCFGVFFLMALKFTKHNLTSPGDSASMLHIRHLKIPHFPRRFSLLTSTGVGGGCLCGLWVSILQHANNGEPNTRRREHFPLFDVTQTDRWDGWSNSSQCDQSWTPQME